MKASQLRARYWRIVLFFAGVTLGFIYWEIFLPRIGLAGWARSTRTERNRRTAVRFRALAIKLGGLMIKVGQFLSARLDILPAEITDELAGLQDEVPPVDFPAIRAHAEAEQQIVEVDLAALRRVGGWLQHYKPVSSRADVNALVEEFALTTRDEVDYLAEGSNAETFAANFAHAPQVHVPVVVWPLSTRRVLTLEDVAAIKLGDYEAITAAGIDRAQVAQVLLDTYMQQIFEDGFFHADPHPGNLFVTPVEGVDEAGNQNWKLTFIDFGMVGHVPENLRTGLREVVIAVGTQDGARLVQAFKTLDVLLPSADLKLIEMASMQVFDRFGGMDMGELRDIDHREMMNFGLQFRELMLDLPFQLPENLLLLGRSVGLLSGMCSGLDPEFNLWTSIAPYATKLIGGEEGESTFQTVLAEATRIFQTTIGLPGRADRVLTQIERGDLNIKTPRLDLQVRRLDRSVRRLTGGLVFAALLVSGAVIYGVDPGLAKWFFGGSALTLVWLMFSGRSRHPGA